MIGLTIQRKARAPQVAPPTCVHCSAPIPAHFRYDNRSCVECKERIARSIRLAHYRIKKLIVQGLMKPIDGQRCVDCGEPAHCYDLRDYNKPQDGVPICRSCNNLRGYGVLRPDKHG